ncbi:MAG: transporter substrate-binding domain-containing protein [Clostridia bacterium]|nr:transporter substrate-binding domain-containing protein [Clostridia bacterium]
MSVVKSLTFTPEYCIYFHNNSELLQKFNVEILELLENGTISKIKEAYKTSDGYYPELRQLSSTAPTIIMATDIAGAPFTDLTENGCVVGIDVDIANIITNSLGYNLEIVVTSTDEMFKMLSEDKVDFIMSGLMYEEKRESVYDASFSYLSVEYYLIERD